jgi:cytolysin (calcineurin-like family phosphatase)
MGGRCPIEIWEGIPVYKKGDARSKYGRKMPDRNMGRQRRIYKRIIRVFHRRAEKYFIEQQRGVSWEGKRSISWEGRGVFHGKAREVFHGRAEEYFMGRQKSNL